MISSKVPTLEKKVADRINNGLTSQSVTGRFIIEAETLAGKRDI